MIIGDRIILREYIDGGTKKCRYCGCDSKSFEPPTYCGEKIIFSTSGCTEFFCDCDDATKTHEINKKIKELEKTKPEFKFSSKIVFSQNEEAKR